MKKIYYIILTTFAFFAFSTIVSAGASLSTSTSSVSVGSSFTATVNLSGVASWNVHVSASGPVSGCTLSAADGTQDTSNTSKSFSTTCKATGTGTIKVTLSGDVTPASGKTEYISGSRTVNVTNASSNNNSSSKKSSNTTNQKSNDNKTDDNKANEDKSNVNTLKSLSVEGQTISPSFDKDKLDYTLTVSSKVKKIKINAEATENKATVSGTGEKELKEGENNFAIIVKAENGEEKTYNLKVNVDDKAITVKVKGKEYTIIKNKEELPKLSIEHEDLTLQIEEQDVPAYRIDKLNYVLIGLKDDKGKIKLFKFDSFKDPDKPFKYTLFNLFTSKELNISYLDFPSKLVPKNYKKYTEVINGEKVTVYKLNKNSNYSLFYGINLETGKKNIYKYDKSEGTMQIYNNDENKNLEKQMELYEYIILGLISLASLFLIIIIIVSISKHKKIKKILKHYNKKMNEISQNITNNQ